MVMFYPITDDPNNKPNIELNELDNLLLDMINYVKNVNLTLS